LPTFATPVVAALGLSSAWAGTAPPQLSASLLAYFALFCVVGQPFNMYWGYTTSAIWGHALVHSAEGVQILIRSAFRARPKSEMP
jgi:hypothetical protein